MDFFAPLISPVVECIGGSCATVVRQIGYIKNLEKNFKKLNEEAGNLFDKKKDTEHEIKRHGNNKEPTHQCRGWLQKVDEIQKEVSSIDKEHSKGDKRCLSRWCLHVPSSWKLGRRIVLKTDAISDLCDKAKFDGGVVVDALPPTAETKPVLTIQDGTSAERTLQKILNSLIIDLGFRYGNFSRYGDTCAEAVMEEVCCMKGLTSLEFGFPKMEYFECFLQRSHPWKKGMITSFHFIVGQYKYRGQFLSWPLYSPGSEGRTRMLTFCGYDSIPNAIAEVLRHAESFKLLGHKSAHSLCEFGMQNMSRLILCRIYECDAMGIMVDGDQLVEAALPNLHLLEISHMPNLRSIWEGSFPPGSLNCLRNLQLLKCGKLKNIFSREIIQQLSNLEVLLIERCCALEEVISDGEIGVESDCVLPKLKRLSCQLARALYSKDRLCNEFV
ncbi:hypothetical protein MRB53_016165 [Persea americana]|uniref:Uncharacterized protein n=1 Tax=Persea americana TaxID=3435 RepID=A0ACC2M2E5_PERAE|nr:hypothetical protein MRB53_016165 [Persea americana]